jgi:aminotransferase
MTEIARLCQQWDVFAVTDEIYEHILYDGSEHVSMASLSGMRERTITINSISKTYSVTGWRVGWAIAPAAVTKSIRKVHDFMTVGAPNPLQHAAAAALQFPKNYYLDLQKKYLSARNYLYALLKEFGFDPVLPKGAYYIIADASHLYERFKAKDDFDFSRKLIKKTRVATVPGFSFYSGRKGVTKQVRFAFCKKPETLQSVKRMFEKNL